MEKLEAIKSRQSYRAFKPDLPPVTLLEDVVAAAGNSPSYTNTQPWEIEIVYGQKKEQLAELLTNLAREKIPPEPDVPIPDQWPPEMEERSRTHGARRLASLGIERSDQEGRESQRLMNFQFYGAPCVIFLFMKKGLGNWSYFDMGLYAQNLSLAAHLVGLGSCIQASVTNYAPAIKEFLGVEAGKMLLVSIALGYPDLDAPLNSYRSVKKPLEDYVTWHR